MIKPRPGFQKPRPPLGRPVRPAAPSMNPMPLVIGGVSVLLIVILIVVMSGDKKEPAPAAAPPPAAAPKPVDVTALETEGRKFCNEGMALIQSLQSRMDGSASLSRDDQRKLRVEVKRGFDLLKKGLEYFGEANEKSGRTYDLNHYQQTKKYVSYKLQELPD